MSKVLSFLLLIMIFISCSSNSNPIINKGNENDSSDNTPPVEIPDEPNNPENPNNPNEPNIPDNKPKVYIIDTPMIYFDGLYTNRFEVNEGDYNRVDNIWRAISKNYTIQNDRLSIVFGPLVQLSSQNHPDLSGDNKERYKRLRLGNSLDFIQPFNKKSSDNNSERVNKDTIIYSYKKKSIIYEYSTGKYTVGGIYLSHHKVSYLNEDDSNTPSIRNEMVIVIRPDKTRTYYGYTYNKVNFLHYPKSTSDMKIDNSRIYKKSDFTYNGIEIAESDYTWAINEKNSL